MNTIPAQTERTEFSERLAAAVLAAGHDARAVMVRREFNVRSGGDTVTEYAVRRWLNGGSLPKQPKVSVLARWLGVTQEWLRFGTGPRSLPDAQVETLVISGDVEMILNDYRRLNDHSKNIFDQTLSTMLKLQAI